MPIRINLLSEALAAEDLRRRDPVKRAIIGGALLVTLSFVWYSSTWLSYMSDKGKLSGVEADIQTRTNEYAQVQSNIKKTSDVEARLDALARLNSFRFLQGNLLNALQQTYVSNVQMIHLREEQTYSSTPAVAAKTNSAGVVMPARPAGATEHMVVQIDAKDYSANPGDQVNHYKEAMLRQDYFKSALDPDTGVKLSALSQLQTGSDSRPYVVFSLECRFHDRP
jgi:hypothetical protein